jgi:hypothetical protein
MPDYSKSKIYAIRSHQTDECYIGSTCQNLAVRLGGHKRTYKSWKNGKNPFISSFILLDKYNDCYIELIEEFECKNKEELNRREGQVIRQTENCVNKNIAGRTDKQYQIDNCEKHKNYYQNNKDMILEKRKQYRQYNADIISEYQKQYRQNNADILSEKGKQKIICDCGSEISKHSLLKHKKTQKHLKLLKIILQSN